MIDIHIDPEFQGMIPTISKAEREDLEASLTVEGCREALMVWTPAEGDGIPILLDGHHRHEWCVTHKKPFRLMEVIGVENRDDAKVWIIRNQLGRRNLPDYERIRLSLLKEEILKGQREQNRLANLKRGEEFPDVANLQHRQRTVESVSQDVGVSPRTVAKVQVIERDADEPTKEALRHGDRSIHSVYQELRPPPKKPKEAIQSFELQTPIVINDPFIYTPDDETDDGNEDDDLIVRWLRTLQHLLAEVNGLEDNGLDSFLTLASEQEFPQFISLLSTLHGRLGDILEQAKKVSVQVIDIDHERTTSNEKQLTESRHS